MSWGGVWDGIGCGVGWVWGRSRRREGGRERAGRRGQGERNRGLRDATELHVWDVWPHRDSVFSCKGLRTASNISCTVYLINGCVLQIDGRIVLTSKKTAMQIAIM